MGNNFKNKIEKLCDMQINFWNEFKNDLSTINDSDLTEEWLKICIIWHTHFKEKNKEMQLLIETNMAVEDESSW